MQSQPQNSDTSRPDRPSAERPHRAPVAALTAVAARHGFGSEAVEALWDAMVLGHGGMAQFSHAEFGGTGQWMRGGMLMIGDMFNNALKSRVGALCDDVARIYADHPDLHEDGQRPAAIDGEWWPEGLHSPSTSGAQNGIRYAYFPAEQRLAIERAGTVELYDTGEHLIGGVSQQQGSSESLRFASQLGAVDLASLRRVGPPGSVASGAAAHRREPNPGAAIATKRPPTQALPGSGAADILETIEKLAGLRERGVLTEAEFTAKKTELLERL